jgi:hypothetical protein
MKPSLLIPLLLAVPAVAPLGAQTDTAREFTMKSGAPGDAPEVATLVKP